MTPILAAKADRAGAAGVRLASGPTRSARSRRDFRRNEDLPGVVQEAVDLGAKTVWMQLGSWNEEAAAIGEAAGLNVVMDRCVKIEHARFHGGLHLAGFNTGVISSKRQVTA